MLAAALLVGAMALLVLRPGSAVGRWRLLALGALLGAAVVVEYPAAIVGLWHCGLGAVAGAFARGGLRRAGRAAAAAGAGHL